MDAVAAPLWQFALVLFRLMPLVLLPEVSPFSRLPVFARLTFGIVFSCLLVVSTPAGPIPPATYPSMAMALISEFLIGLALAFSLYLAFAVLRFYGQQIDLQIGFGAAGILDPIGSNVGSVFGTSLAFAGMMLFFICGFQRDLITGLAASLNVVPLGGAALGHGPGWLITLLNREFLFGFAVVAPIAIGLFLLDVLIAYASRLMPQANVYFLGLPVKIGIGLVLMALSLRLAGPAISRLIIQGFSSWQGVLGA